MAKENVGKFYEKLAKDAALAKWTRLLSNMNFIDTRLRDYFAHNPGCAVCEYRNRCAGGCRGNVAGRREGATTATGASVGAAEVDLLARDEDACAFFRQGWYDRVTKLMEKILPDIR